MIILIKELKMFSCRGCGLLWHDHDMENTTCPVCELENAIPVKLIGAELKTEDNIIIDVTNYADH